MKNVLPLLGLLVFFVISCNTKKSKKSTSKIHSKIKVEKLDNAVLYGGSLERVERFPSKNIKERIVDIWLPKNYNRNQKYPVLYMHDGQNLFDSTTTWNRQEWKVDEWITKLKEKDSIQECIVVGIHSISDIRWQDLFPQKAMNYLSMPVQDSLYAKAKEENINLNFTGDAYLKFLVEELKPFIDTNYTTQKDQAHTFVGGSSMGGLMSMYAICEYPEVFSGAVCVSTHWPGGAPSNSNPFPKAIFNYLKKHIPSPNNHKFYFDYGTNTLDAFYPKYAKEVDSIFYNGGYTPRNYKNLKFEGADHSENSWNKRFNVPLIFLLQNK